MNIIAELINVHFIIQKNKLKKIRLTPAIVVNISFLAKKRYLVRQNAGSLMVQSHIVLLLALGGLLTTKRSRMATKKVTISLTQEQQDKAKKDSIEVFGKENLSGYIQYLIQNGLKNSKERGQK